MRGQTKHETSALHIVIYDRLVDNVKKLSNVFELYNEVSIESKIPIFRALGTSHYIFKVKQAHKANLNL